MIWFISAMLVASAIFMFAPKSLAVSSSPAAGTDLGQKILFLLPLGLLLLLLANLITGNFSINAFVATSFALTGCSVAIPPLHRFIAPCAGITAMALISLVIQTF